MTSTTITTGLLIALLVLILVSLASLVTLYVLRRRRQSLAKTLPLHQKPTSFTRRPKQRNTAHRRVAGITIPSRFNTRRRSAPTFVDAEKAEFIKGSDSAPTSPLPQIHITFPEEVDESGNVKTGSGRVVKVFVDDKGGLGMEPVNSEDGLPPYVANEGSRFVSLDLERMGGLKERA